MEVVVVVPFGFGRLCEAEFHFTKIFFSVLSFFAEEPSVNTKDVRSVAEEFGLFAMDSEELQEEFGSKDLISHAVFLFNKQMNFHSSISLKEYFS